MGTTDENLTVHGLDCILDAGNLCNWIDKNKSLKYDHPPIVY